LPGNETSADGEMPSFAGLSWQFRNIRGKYLPFRGRSPSA